MMLVRVDGRFYIPLRFFQDAFQVDVDYERDTFLPDVVLEAQPLVVFAR